MWIILLFLNWWNTKKNWHMNAIVRKLKLYRISTVLNYCRNSWDNSAFVIKQCPSKSRFSVFVDLLYWYIFYGNDFNDYCTFTFWNKSIAERISVPLKWDELNN